MEVPPIIPVFPLPNVVLFPGVPLPLHIFEPRYRQLVRDAASAHEIIGIALLRGEWQPHYFENPDIFETGCAGKIVNLEPLPEGKCNIVLHGFREYRIDRHIFDKPYRQAAVHWRIHGPRSIDGTSRSRLVDLLTGFLGRDPHSPAYRLLHDRTLTDDLLVNFFSFALEIAPIEKQGLLEALTLAERAERLREILEFHLEEARCAIGPPGPHRCH